MSSLYVPATIPATEQFDSTILFRDFAQNAMREYAVEVEKRTFRGYEQILERVNEAIGHIPLCDLKPWHIRDLTERLGADGINKRTGGGLSSKSVKNHITFISGVLTKAVQAGIISFNPADAGHIKPVKVAGRVVEVLNEDEYVRFLEELRTAPDKWKIFAILLMLTGARRGEIVGLKWSDIDFKRCVLHIRRSVGYTSADGIFEKTTKTKAGERSFRISNELCELLRKYREWWDSERMVANYDKDKLFQKRGGGYIHPDSFTDWLKKFCRTRKLRNINARMLRHTNISALVMSNIVSLKEVSIRAGHSNIAVTCDIYAHEIKTAAALAQQPLDTLFPVGRVFDVKVSNDILC